MRKKALIWRRMITCESDMTSCDFLKNIIGHLRGALRNRPKTDLFMHTRPPFAGSYADYHELYPKSVDLIDDRFRSSNDINHKIPPDLTLPEGGNVPLSGKEGMGEIPGITAVCTLRLH